MNRSGWKLCFKVKLKRIIFTIAGELYRYYMEMPDFVILIRRVRSRADIKLQYNGRLASRPYEKQKRHFEVQ